MSLIYLFLALVGAALPYSQFVPWLMRHGLDVRLMLTELFANRVSTFFALDVLISAIVLLVFIRHELGLRRMKLWWLPILATLLVGVSCGLPLFLFLRERPAKES